MRAINGVYNYSASQARARRADQRFESVLESFRRIQQAGALNVRIEKRGDRELTHIGLRSGVSGESDKSIRELQQTLGIRAENDEPLLVFGALNRNPDEVAVLTRSVQEMLTELSSGVEVSERDRLEGRASPIYSPRGDAEATHFPLIRIRSTADRPADAYASVQYRGHWFWIDDRDLGSKRMIMFLTVFSSLAETGTAPQVPLITIPAR